MYTFISALVIAIGLLIWFFPLMYSLVWGTWGMVGASVIWIFVFYSFIEILEKLLNKNI
jgi:hypothetical protein